MTIANQEHSVTRTPLGIILGVSLNAVNVQ